jgi:glycosyltransferase involved in cell wall biosynthesis
MKPRISVVLATYNRAEFLAPAIESVFAQTSPHLEIVVVDDGSTDGTRVLLERLTGRVTPIFLPHTGNPASRLNTGIRASRGALVAFLDSDDLWLPDKLERQLALLDADPRYGFSYCNGRLLYPDGRQSAPALAPRQIVAGSVLGTMLRNMCIHPSTVLVRREWLERLGGLDESRPVGYDLSFFLRLARATDAVCVAEPVVLFRQHAGQLSKAWGLDGHRAAITAIEELRVGPLPWRVRLAARKALAHHHSHLAKNLIEAGDVAQGRRHALSAFRRWPLHRPAWRWVARGVIG